MMRFEWKFSKIVKAILLLLAMAAAVWVIDYRCPLRAATGIPCPGCGMTRAYAALIGGRGLAAAMRLHPLFWAAPVLMALIFMYNIPAKGKRKFHRGVEIALAGLCVLFLIVWIVRLAAGTAV